MHPSDRLLTAARHGDLEHAKQAIRDGAAVDASEGSATALLWACFYGQGEVAAYLIERGASIDAVNWHGSTPLHLAAENGLTSLATLLMERGADRQAKDGEDKTPSGVEAPGTGIEWDALTPEAAAALEADASGLKPLLLSRGKPTRILLELLGAHRLPASAIASPLREEIAKALERGKSGSLPRLFKERAMELTREAQRRDALEGGGF